MFEPLKFCCILQKKITGAISCLLAFVPKHLKMDLFPKGKNRFIQEQSPFERRGRYENVEELLPLKVNPYSLR